MISEKINKVRENFVKKFIGHETKPEIPKDIIKEFLNMEPIEFISNVNQVGKGFDLESVEQLLKDYCFTVIQSYDNANLRLIGNKKGRFISKKFAKNKDLSYQNMSTKNKIAIYNIYYLTGWTCLIQGSKDFSKAFFTQGLKFMRSHGLETQQSDIALFLITLAYIDKDKKGMDDLMEKAYKSTKIDLSDYRMLKLIHSNFYEPPVRLYSILEKEMKNDSV